MRTYSKVIASIFLLYHLVVVIVLANNESLLARQLYPWIAPYANTLGLNTTWQFFSPNPALHRYVEYELVTEAAGEEPLRRDDVGEEQQAGSDDDGEELQVGSDAARAEDASSASLRWPPLDTENLWHENFLRRVYHSMRATYSETQTVAFLVPFLCRKHPEADAVVMRVVVKQIPSIEKALIIDSDFLDMQTRLHSSLKNYPCERAEL